MKITIESVHPMSTPRTNPAGYTTLGVVSLALRNKETDTCIVVLNDLWYAEKNNDDGSITPSLMTSTYEDPKGNKDDNGKVYRKHPYTIFPSSFPENSPKGGGFRFLPDMNNQSYQKLCQQVKARIVAAQPAGTTSNNSNDIDIL